MADKMDVAELQKWITVISSTLFEMPNHWSPKTPIYMALGMDMDNFNVVMSIMEKTGLVEVTATTVKLTAKGSDLGEKMNSILMSAKK